MGVGGRREADGSTCDEDVVASSLSIHHRLTASRNCETEYHTRSALVSPVLSVLPLCRNSADHLPYQSRRRHKMPGLHASLPPSSTIPPTPHSQLHHNLTLVTHPLGLIFFPTPSTPDVFIGPALLVQWGRDGRVVELDKYVDKHKKGEERIMVVGGGIAGLLRGFHSQSTHHHPLSLVPTTDQTSVRLVRDTHHFLDVSGGTLHALLDSIRRRISPPYSPRSPLCPLSLRSVLD